MDIPFGKILSSIGRGIVVFDNGGLITYLNPHASLLLDYTADEILGKYIDDIFKFTMDGSGTEKPVKENIYDTVIFGGKSFNSATYPDTIFISSRGMHFPISLVATPIFSADRITGGIISFSDISVEEKKRQELMNMRRKVSVLGKELEDKQELEEMNKLMVGRELRMAEMKEEMDALKKKLKE